MLGVFFYFITLSPSSEAIHLGLNATQVQEKVQNRAGKEAGDPISPGIAIGHDFQIGESALKFSPKLGYVKAQEFSGDRYAGTYETQTIYVLYDLSHPINLDQSLWSRFGIGNFIKSTKGQGGTVTIPNGGGTSLSNRPGKAQTSYSSSLNLGLDWMFSRREGFVKSYAMNGEIFAFELFDRKKRLFALQIGITAYF